MTGPTSAWWRTTRAGAFAVVTGYLAALGHLAGGGGFPDLGPLVVTTALVGVVVAGLTQSRRTAPQILGVMIAAQLAFHCLFALAGHPGSGSGQLDLARMAAFHLVAAVLATVVLARGERAIFTLFAALHRAVLRLVSSAPIPWIPSWSVLATADDRCPAIGPLLASRPRRGPPATN